MAWWMAIPAVLGAVAGGFSSWQNSEKEKESLRRQKENAWEQYLLGQRHSDEQYGVQRAEAAFQAGAARARLERGVDFSTDKFNTGLLAQAFGIQDARIQTASGIGASLAAEGASGTRGSTAGSMARAYAEQGLERSIDIQKQQNDQQLSGMLTQASNSLADIVRERNSWDPGGYRYALKQSQDDYNRDMAKLGQSNFNWQIEQASPTALDYITGIFGGASSGMAIGQSLYDFKNAWFDVGKKKGQAATVGQGVLGMLGKQ